MTPKYEGVHRWTQTEDDFLIRMNRRAASLGDMAARFGVSKEEVEGRLAWLAALQDADRQREAQVQAAAQRMQAPQMDAATVIATKLMRGYEVMGQDLENLARIITSYVSADELAAVVDAYAVGKGPALMAVLDSKEFAQALLTHFVVTPKVMVQLVPATPTPPPSNASDTQTNSTEGDTSAADGGGNLRGEESQKSSGVDSAAG